jgi:hypothetical protein
MGNKVKALFFFPPRDFLEFFEKNSKKSRGGVYKFVHKKALETLLNRVLKVP